MRQQTKPESTSTTDQAASMLRDIYDERDPVTTFRERVKLTHWLHKLAQLDAKIEYPWHYPTKAELFLRVAERGVYVHPFAEAVRELWEEAKARPTPERVTEPEPKAPRFTPTYAQNVTADTLRKFREPPSSEYIVSQSIRNRTTRALKHLHRIATEDAPDRTFPAPTEPGNLYLEVCRARAEGVKTEALRGALESVEAMTYEARRAWERAKEAKEVTESQSAAGSDTTPKHGVTIRLPHPREKKPATY